MVKMDIESARSVFQITFMAAAYIVPFELLGLGIADPRAFPSDWFLLAFATLSGFSMLWSAPLGKWVSKHLHY